MLLPYNMHSPMSIILRELIFKEDVRVISTTLQRRFHIYVPKYERRNVLSLLQYLFNKKYVSENDFSLLYETFCEIVQKYNYVRYSTLVLELYFQQMLYSQRPTVQCIGSPLFVPMSQVQ